MIPNLPIYLHQNIWIGFGGFVLTRFNPVKCLIWIISLWSPLTIIIFLPAHLPMIPNLTIKFHHNPLRGLEVFALTRNVDRQTDRQTDMVK